MNATAAIIDHLQARVRSNAGRSLMWSMAAAISARLGLLVLAIVMAHRFGPADYGVFTFATGVALLCSQLSVLGWPTLMNRLIPGMLRDRDWPLLKGLLFAGDAVVFGAGLAVVAALLLIGLFIPDPRSSLMLSAALVIPFSFAILRRQQLAALRRPALGLFLDQGLGAAIAVVILLVARDFTLREAVLVFAGTIVLSVSLGTFAMRRQLPTDLSSTRTRRIEFRYWMATAMPMLIGVSSKLLMNKTDILMLPPLSTMHETGLYGAAFRVTYLLTFPQIVMMSVITPLLSEAFTHGQLNRVRRLVRGARLFALVTAVPSSLALALLSPFIMTHLFGRSFEEGALALSILAIGQLFMSLSIPTQALLTMGGREKMYGTLNAAALGIHVVVNLALIPPYGALGAAISTTVVGLCLSAGQYLINRPLLKGTAA